MTKYLFRMVKFLIIFGIIFLILVLVIPFIAFGRPFSDSLNEIITEGQAVIGLIVLYALLYPVINFVHLKRHINGTFEDNRKFFEEAFSHLNYVKTSESGSVIVYRKNTTGRRALLYWDDEIELNIADNPVIISGLRKMANRIYRLIEQDIIKASEFGE
jgi:hypothetical protein